jgi:hypothetical protein
MLKIIKALKLIEKSTYMAAGGIFATGQAKVGGLVLLLGGFVGIIAHALDSALDRSK